MQTNHLLGNKYRSFYGTSLQCDSMPLHLHTKTLFTHLIIQTFALSMVFSSFPPYYRHQSFLVFFCLWQNILDLSRYQVLPSCEASAAGKTEMVKWLGSWSSWQNLLLIRGVLQVDLDGKQTLRNTTEIRHRSSNWGARSRREKGRSFDLLFLLQPPHSLNFPPLCAPWAARLLLALSQHSPEVNHSLSLPSSLPAAGPWPPPTCCQAHHPTLKRSAPAFSIAAAYNLHKKWCVLFRALLAPAQAQQGPGVVSWVPPLSTHPCLCTEMHSSHTHTVLIHLLCAFKD